MAPKDFSFDIMSTVDMMEVKNAVLQAEKELANRYDFKGSKCEILHEKEDLSIIADDEFKMDQLKDIVLSKLLKRGIDIRQVEFSKPEPGTGLTLKSKVTFKQGISQDIAKPLIKQIKDKGFKVQAQIQGDEIRVTGKDKDELQKVMAFVKGLDLLVPVTFGNYR